MKQDMKLGRSVIYEGRQITIKIDGNLSKVDAQNSLDHQLNKQLPPFGAKIC